jgi:hypothetical protein
MQDPAQRLLNYGVDWRALFILTLVFAAFSLLSLASVALVPSLGRGPLPVAHVGAPR